MQHIGNNFTAFRLMPKTWKWTRMMAVIMIFHFQEILMIQPIFSSQIFFFFCIQGTKMRKEIQISNQFYQQMHKSGGDVLLKLSLLELSSLS